MQRMGVEEGEVIEHPLVTGAISRAQKRVEAYNFDIRKHLLEYDNVMNQQRTIVYDLRNKTLQSADVSEMVLESLEDAVAEKVDKATEGGQGHRDDWNLKGLADELSFMLMRPVPVADLESPTAEALVEKAVEIGEAAYRAREAEFTAPVLRDLERHLYLYTLDEHWRDHLYELDHLKGGIGLRAYGQRDPLIEYKKEAFTLFETLVGEVRDEFVQRLFRVQLAPQAVQEIERRPRPRQMVAQHAEAGSAFAGQPRRAAEDGGQAAPEAREAQPARVVPVRTGPRVGRNDPCPCGSGKKYKKCHMQSDEGAETGT
jgi:preprotein translocase subunit SecA